MEQASLFRFSAVNGVIMLDKDTNRNGRGAYLCGDCLKIYNGEDTKERNRFISRMHYQLTRKKL